MFKIKLKGVCYLGAVRCADIITLLSIILNLE